MRKIGVLAIVAGFALVTLSSIVPAASAGGRPLILLRVAPVGFVIPANPVLETEAQWLVDPAENPDVAALDGVAGCWLNVPDRNGNGRIDGGDVLNQATIRGCISGWDYTTFSCCGRFVTMVDGLEQAGWPVSFWFIQIDGRASSVGIDDMNLQSYQSLDFVYYVGPV